MAFAAGDRLLFDSNALIFAIETGNPWTHGLKTLIAAGEDGRVDLVVSELALAEVLVLPLRDRADDLVALYEAFLQPNRPFRTVPVDRVILRRAAALRADGGHRLADAIHLATAEEAGCTVLLTADERLGRKLGARPRWLRPADLSTDPLRDSPP